jgi:hypothetical protein
MGYVSPCHYRNSVAARPLALLFRKQRNQSIRGSRSIAVELTQPHVKSERGGLIKLTPVALRYCRPLHRPSEHDFRYTIGSRSVNEQLAPTVQFRLQFTPARHLR